MHFSTAAAVVPAAIIPRVKLASQRPTIPVMRFLTVAALAPAVFIPPAIVVFQIKAANISR
jgi:hypothetical protein